LFARVLAEPEQSLLTDMFQILRQLLRRRVVIAELAPLRLRIAQWLSRAEVILPATEMAMVMHLMVHLPDEIARWGPVKEFYMYPVERYNNTCCLADTDPACSDSSRF